MLRKKNKEKGFWVKIGWNSYKIWFFEIILEYYIKSLKLFNIFVIYNLKSF